MTDPNGNVTYTVYNDAAYETRVYSGWNATTNMPTGPTRVSRQDRPGSYSESLTMSAAPAVDVNGRPTENGKALSWPNLHLRVSAYVQRYCFERRFLELDVQ